MKSALMRLTPSLHAGLGRPSIRQGKPLLKERALLILCSIAGLMAFSPPGRFQSAILLGIASLLILHLVTAPSGIRISPWLCFWTLWLLSQSVWVRGSSTSALVDLVPTLAAITCGAALAGASRAGTPYKYFAIAGSAMCILSLASAVISPETAVTSVTYEQGALNGLYIHRNVMGFVASVAFILVIAVRLEKQLKLLATVFWAAAPLVALVWAQSRTAWIATAFAVFVMMFVRIPRSAGAHRVRNFLLFVAVAGACVSVLLFDQLSESAFGAIGRDASLTGRTDIWAEVIIALEDIWLAGIGWGIPWREGEPVTEQIWSRIGFQSGHAHNSYLDLVLQTGIIGLVLVVGLLVSALIRSIRTMNCPTNFDARITLAIMSTVVVRSLTESVYHLSFVGLLLGYWAVSRTRSSAIRPRSNSEMSVKP